MRLVLETNNGKVIHEWDSVNCKTLTNGEDTMKLALSIVLIMSKYLKVKENLTVVRKDQYDE